MAAEGKVVLEAPESRKKLTVAKQFKRNMLIVATRMEGDTWPVIAERHEISVARCKKIFEEYRKENPTLEGADPTEIAKELLEGFQADIATANQGIHQMLEADDGLSGLGGLLHARMKARENVATLLQALGVMPHDLGTLRVEVEANVFVDKVITVLKQYDLPDAAWDQLLEALGGPPPDLELMPGSRN